MYILFKILTSIKFYEKNYFNYLKSEMLVMIFYKIVHLKFKLLPVLPISSSIL